MRTGRPRSVLLEIMRSLTPGWSARKSNSRRGPVVSRIVPSPEQLREAARLIARSRFPLIYAGGGVARSDAEDTLVKLAEATNIPVVTSSGGKGRTTPWTRRSCFRLLRFLFQPPVVIDAPFAEMPIPRAPQIAFVYNLPWTHPQEGRIDS